MTKVYAETEKGSFSHVDDGYDGISDVELQSMFQQCRSFLASLVSELNQRGLKAGQIAEWEKTLRRTSNRLRVRERLEDQDLKVLEFARQLMKKKILNTHNKLYQCFVFDVMRCSNAGFALLCIISFGQKMVVELKEEGRIDLLELIKDKVDSMSSSVLNTLATENRILELAGM